MVEKTKSNLAAAKKMYPILEGLEYDIVETPDEEGPYALEHFSPGEEGSVKSPRPDGIPLDRYGLHVFKTTKPEDIAGDIISHRLVNDDPYLSKKYKEFKEVTSPEVMERRYEFHQKNLGEERAYDLWAETTGFPELLRGHVFNQFPEEAKDSLYTDEQKRILEDIKTRVTQPKEFNKGGTTMSMTKQMEMFEDGGLSDEGGTIDEMSGNDVPTGSLKEEVRDDIPAQLSEGEFVLPADVVRYHGLDKIMRLRDEAKAGIARMEAMGQMGNSEEAVLPDDVPFSLDDLDLEEEEVTNDTLEMNVGGLVPQQQPYGVIQPPQVGTPNYATGTYQMPSAFTNYQQQFVQPSTVQPPQITTAPVQPVVPTYTQPVPEQRQYSFTELMPRTVDMETKNALGRTTAGNIDYSSPLYSGTGVGQSGEKKGSSVVGDTAKIAAVGYGLQKLGVDNFIGKGVETGIAKAGTFLKGLGGKSGTPVITGAMYDAAAKTPVITGAMYDAVAKTAAVETAAVETAAGKLAGGKAAGIGYAAPVFVAAVTALALFKGLFGMESSAAAMNKYHKGLDKKRLEDSGFYAYRDAIESFTGMDYGDYIKSITPPRNPYQMSTDNLPRTDDGLQEEEMLMNYYKNTARGQKEMSDFYSANPKFFTPTGERVFPEGPLGDMQRAAQEYSQSGGKRGLSPTQIVNQMAKDEKLLDAMAKHPEAFKEAVAVGSQSVTEEDIAELQAATEENPQA